jgi:hypothetical protein
VAELNEPTQLTPPPQEPFTPSERAVKLHDEYRKKAWEDSVSGSENFDKYLLAFSSGALGLSLTFIKDIVPLKDAIWIPSLIVSWGAFIACILVTLASFRISIRALEKMSPALDDFYLKGNADAFNKHLESWWTKAVDWCAYAGIFFFVLGLTCTMIFAGVNVARANGMAEKESPPQGNPIRIDRIDFGCKPPAMTPITQDAKPEVKGKANDLGKGVKPVPMTPVRPTPPPLQPCPAVPPKK